MLLAFGKGDAGIALAGVGVLLIVGFFALQFLKPSSMSEEAQGRAIWVAAGGVLIVVVGLFMRGSAII